MCSTRVVFSTTSTSICDIHVLCLDAFVWISYGEKGYTTDVYFGVSEVLERVVIDDDSDSRSNDKFDL